LLRRSVQTITTGSVFSISQNSSRVTVHAHDAGSFEFAMTGGRHSESTSNCTTYSRCGGLTGRIVGPGSQVGMAQCVDESNIEAPLVLWPAFFRKSGPIFDAAGPNSVASRPLRWLGSVLLLDGPGWVKNPSRPTPDLSDIDSLRFEHEHFVAKSPRNERGLHSGIPATRCARAQGMWLGDRDCDDRSVEPAEAPGEVQLTAGSGALRCRGPLRSFRKLRPARRGSIRGSGDSEAPDAGNHEHRHRQADRVQRQTDPHEIAEPVAAGAIDDQMGLVCDR